MLNRHCNYEIDTIPGVQLPIAFQFRKFFEKDDKLLTTIKNMDSIFKNDQNSHFIQGSLNHSLNLLMVK